MYMKKQEDINCDKHSQRLEIRKKITVSDETQFKRNKYQKKKTY